MLYELLSWKVTFHVTSKPTPPTVFNLQASTGFNVKRKQVRISNYLGIPINFYFFLLQIFLIVYFAKKNMRISKNSIKFIIHFFQKKIIWHIYIFTKYNANFKFSTSWQKIFTNKIIFSKHDVHALFISFFSKMHNKKIYLLHTIPLKNPKNNYLLDILK